MGIGIPTNYPPYMKLGIILAPIAYTLCIQPIPQIFLDVDIRNKYMSYHAFYIGYWNRICLSDQTMKREKKLSALYVTTGQNKKRRSRT